MNPDPYKHLAAQVIFFSLTRARKGDKVSRQWLTESAQIQIFCSALDIEHQALVKAIDRPGKLTFRFVR